MKAFVNMNEQVERLKVMSRDASGLARVRALAPCEKGSSLLEVALTISIVMTTIFGILICSLLFYADHFVSNAAAEAVRYAIVRGSSWNGAACAASYTANCTATASSVSTYVSSIVPPGISAGSVAVVTRWPGTTPAGSACDTYDAATGVYSGTNNPSCSVVVTVNYSFRFLFPFFPAHSATLSSTAAAAIVM
jgi:Flp pilus assembly protein TadG